MTSIQRVEAAFSHREPDRTPLFEYVLLSPVADELLGHPYFDYRGQTERWTRAVAELGFDPALRRHVADRVELAVRLGHDLLYVCPNPVPPDRSSSPPPDAGESPDDPVGRVAARNLLRREHVNRDAATLATPGASFLVFDLLKAEMERRGIDLPFIVPDYAHGVWTDTDLMETMALDPATAHEHFAICTANAIRAAHRYVAAGIRLIGIGGDFAGKRPIISADMYRGFIVPELRKLAREIHRLGARCVNTSDGDLWYVMDDFLLGTEADGYLEIDQGAGMDLKRLKTRYGATITFLGNIDCGNLLSTGSLAEIRRATVACLDHGRGDGGHIFTASNAITESVSLGNYLAMVNAYRDYWGMQPLSV